jgi:molybdopterin-binding protein
VGISARNQLKGKVTEVILGDVTPTNSIIAAIRTILAAHNPLEEGSAGVYAQCEQLAGSESDQILVRLQSTPAVRMASHVDNPVAMESARQALQRAGYDLKF